MTKKRIFTAILMFVFVFTSVSAFTEPIADAKTVTYQYKVVNLNP